MKNKNYKALEVLGEFVGHMLVGAAMFVSLALVGGGLSVFVHWYGGIVGTEFGDLLKVVETGILYADIVFLAWWVVFSTYKAMKDL
ncbi:hypothetical protein [Rhodoferax antarcticus]|uniref:hypothetical protein n=1 Tax=Rhodoferax antarcticus TaxID=81479 RepID=UPI00094FB61A|nr:hypothetical protein [Rhodoferax antarcticus]